MAAFEFLFFFCFTPSASLLAGFCLPWQGKSCQFFVAVDLESAAEEKEKNQANN